MNRISDPNYRFKKFVTKYGFNSTKNEQEAL